MERDFLQAVPHGDGGAYVTMAPNVSEVLRFLVTNLVEALETGKLPPKRLFPDAYRDRQRSQAFRDRYGSAMRAEVIAAARRTLSGLRGRTELLLGRAEVRDWYIAFGHAQSLLFRRPRWRRSLRARTFGPGRVNVFWLRAVQDRLATVSLTNGGAASHSVNT